MDASSFALRTNNASGVALPEGASLLNPAGLDDGGPSHRFASMSISRNPAGCTLRTSHRLEGREVRDIMNIGDIEGTHKRERFPHTRDTYHQTADIPGATAKPRHVHRTGHHDIMAHDDIEGTRVRTLDLQTKRQVDPLDPRYQLPSVPDMRSDALPFKRDLLTDVSDIDGTRSLPMRSFSNGARGRSRRVGEGHYGVDRTLNIDDIEGTKSVSQIRSLTGHTDPLNVRDITDLGLKTSKRDTNQLNPVYVVNGMVIQDPTDTKARSPRKARDGKGEMLSLHTGDIEGARPATWGEQKVGVIRLDQRKNFTVTNKIDDIEGTRAGSRLRGIKSQRADTDANERNYTLLDGTAGNPEDLLVGHGWYTASKKLVAMEASARLADRQDENVVAHTAAKSNDTIVGPGPEKLSKTAWASQKSAAAAASSGRTFTAYPQEKPTQRMARKLLDPRDAEIAALRGQLEATLQNPAGSRSRSAGAVSSSSSAVAAGVADDAAIAGYADPYAALRGKDGVPPSGKPSGLEVTFDPRATSKARAAAKKQASNEPGGVGMGTLRTPVGLDEGGGAGSSHNNGELSFSKMLANTIMSGQASAKTRSSPLKGTKSLSATSALTLMAGTKASSSQRHDTMVIRKQARDRESELSAVRSLPI